MRSCCYCSNTQICGRRRRMCCRQLDANGIVQHINETIFWRDITTTQTGRFIYLILFFYIKIKCNHSLWLRQVISTHTHTRFRTQIRAHMCVCTHQITARLPICLGNELWQIYLVYLLPELWKIYTAIWQMYKSLLVWHATLLRRPAHSCCNWVAAPVTLFGWCNISHVALYRTQSLAKRNNGFLWIFIYSFTARFSLHLPRRWQHIF